MMKKLNDRNTFVVDFDIYTDGDIGFNSDLLKNHTSRYFDSKFFEYTEINKDDYSYKFRRVFAVNEFNDAVTFLTALKNSLYGDGITIETIRRLIQEAITGLKRVILGESTKAIFPDWPYPDETTVWRLDFNYQLDGNVELDFRGYFTGERPRKIKKIIYKDEV